MRLIVSVGEHVRELETCQTTIGNTQLSSPRLRLKYRCSKMPPKVYIDTSLSLPKQSRVALRRQKVIYGHNVDNGSSCILVQHGYENLLRMYIQIPTSALNTT